MGKILFYVNSFWMAKLISCGKITWCCYYKEESTKNEWALCTKNTGIKIAVLSCKIRFAILHWLNLILHTYFVWVKSLPNFLNFSMFNVISYGLNLILYKIIFCISGKLIWCGLNIIYIRRETWNEIEPLKWFFPPWYFGIFRDCSVCITVVDMCIYILHDEHSFCPLKSICTDFCFPYLCVTNTKFF